jgi:hypothetical protein
MFCQGWLGCSVSREEKGILKLASGGQEIRHGAKHQNGKLHSMSDVTKLIFLHRQAFSG